jgi:hypothetical protein
MIVIGLAGYASAAWAGVNPTDSSNAVIAVQRCLIVFSPYGRVV